MGTNYRRLLFVVLLEHIRQFIREVKAEDFAGLAVPLDSKTQWTCHHRPIKRHGGHPPKDYSALETFIDLRIAMDKGEYTEAIGMYYYLKRLLGR